VAILNPKVKYEVAWQLCLRRFSVIGETLKPEKVLDSPPPPPLDGNFQCATPRDLPEIVHGEMLDFRPPPPISLHFTFESDPLPPFHFFSLFLKS